MAPSQRAGLLHDGCFGRGVTPHGWILMQITDPPIISASGSDLPAHAVTAVMLIAEEIQSCAPDNSSDVMSWKSYFDTSAASNAPAMLALAMMSNLVLMLSAT